jgi:hypothetical protein
MLILPAGSGILAAREFPGFPAIRVRSGLPDGFIGIFSPNFSFF